MEEILASIRRIIADDDQEPVRRPVARRDESAADVRRPDAPRPEAPRGEPARQAGARPDAARAPAADPRMQAPTADRVRHETERAFAPRMEAPRLEAGHADHFGLDSPRGEAPRPVPPRPPDARPPEVRRPEVAVGEPPRAAPRPEPIRAEPVRNDLPYSEPVRYGTQRSDAQHVASQEPPRPTPRQESVPLDGGRSEHGRPDPVRTDSARREAARSEHGSADGQGGYQARPEVLNAAIERAVADTRFSQDERRFPGHDAEPVARHPEQDAAGVQSRPASLRAESAPDAIRPIARPIARPVADARPARPSVFPEARRKDLLSPAVDAAVMAAFESLGDVSLGQTALPEQGRTVEDLIKEILRPMLKTWLDEHLPDIVERLVRAEIERVARNGR